MQSDVFSEEQIQDFCSSLSQLIAGDVRSDRMTRALYSTDASLYRIMPSAVLIPKHRDDVQAALEVARKFRMPVLARGGGSSLAGQTTCPGLVIDFTKHIDRFVEYNPEERTVRVEAGMVFDRLNGQLSRHGVMIGPDPASGNRATFGGIVGNNATGTHSILFGSIVDHIVSAEGFLSDGSPMVFGDTDTNVWASRASSGGSVGSVYSGLQSLLNHNGDIIRRDTPRHWRRSGGYRLERMLEEPRNLAHLLCGSEGTLAVINDVTLGCVDRPKKTALGVVHFASRMASLEAVETILSTDPSAVELFDRIGIEQCRSVPAFAARLAFVEGDPDALLITEYYGESDAELKGKLERLDEVVRKGEHGYANVHLYDPSAINGVWTARKEGLGLMLGVRGDHKAVAIIEDVAVPVAALPSYIGRLETLFQEVDVRWLMYAHASAGCIHVRPFINAKDAAEVSKMKVISETAAGWAKEFNGTLSSEHGEGLARSWLSRQFYGPELYETYRQVKAVFDPDNRLNPGKVVDAPSMLDNLRINPDYRTEQIAEKLDFSKDGGFARAIEICTGVGTCRKETGTMCPSFMVTREEEHSTRGRANALREALAGTLGPEAFTGSRLKEVLSLCVSCKACKAECPSAVDMAKLKLEWQGHYWDKNRMPLRDRLFAHLPTLSRKMAGISAGVVNKVAGTGFVRAAMDKAFGISAERVMPPFAPVPFSQWFERHQGKTTAEPDVVLFHDTWNSYHKTRAAIAAACLFDAAGVQVELGKHRCCGRTYMSKGLVERARMAARETVDALYPQASRGLPIVGLEPSCILSLRDEYLTLLPGDPKAEVVAKMAVTFEEYVAQLRSEGAISETMFNTDVPKILVHGHCHQKALGGMETSIAALSLPGNEVEVIDSSCCGMAGAFGYEKEHVKWSIAMAERSLAPAVRAADPDVPIVAAGFSCGSQIEQTTGRAVMHPAEWLFSCVLP